MSSAPESAILMPVATGSGQPESQWEEFTLTNVRVERKNPRGRGYVQDSLLTASNSTVLRVTGRLAPVKPEQQLYGEFPQTLIQDSEAHAHMRSPR